MMRTSKVRKLRIPQIMSFLLALTGTVLILAALAVNELFVDDGTSPYHSPMVQTCRWDKYELSLNGRKCTYSDCYGESNRMEHEKTAGMIWMAMCVTTFFAGLVGIGYCTHNILRQTRTGKRRAIECVFFLIAGVLAIVGSGCAFYGGTCAQNVSTHDRNGCNQCADISFLGKSLIFSFTAFPLFIIASFVGCLDVYGCWQMACVLCCPKSERARREFQEVEMQAEADVASDNSDESVIR